MFKQFFDFFQQVLLLTRATEQNKAEIKDIHREMERLTAALQRLAYEHQKVLHEQQRTSDEAKRTREMLSDMEKNERTEREKLDVATGKRNAEIRASPAAD